MELKVNEDAWRPNPGVINTDMIRKAVSKMIEDEVPGVNIDEEEGYKYNEITHLYLEHLDILKIDYLWIMPALQVLKLTGNLIEKMENLNTLENLVDLNLSFNKITEIENLEKLTKLRHLSLYSNMITEIKNLDSLENLKIFTIGKNLIKDKTCILKLRKLNLFSLNMADNPCSRDDGFRHYLAAYLPKLEYYEYKKITDEERETGRVIYLRDLELLEREESEAAEKASKDKAKASQEEKYAEAYVEDLDGDQLYEMMLQTDSNGQAMLLIGDEVQELFKTFQADIRKSTTEIFKMGLEQLELRKNEVELFEQGKKDAILKSRAQQRRIMERFLENKNYAVIEMNDLMKNTSEESLRKSIETKVDKINTVCNIVKKELLSLELILSEQIKEVFALFERSLGDMVNSFIETAQGHFTNMRESETTFSEQLGDQVSRYLTQLTIRNEDISSLPPALRPIMVDKESVNSAVATSHDTHLQIIDTREDVLMSRIRNWYQKLCADYEQDEITYFRGRVKEIYQFLEIQAKDIQQYNIPVDEEIYMYAENN